MVRLRISSQYIKILLEVEKMAFVGTAYDLEELVAKNDFDLYITKAVDSVEEIKIKMKDDHLSLEFLKGKASERLSRFKITASYSGLHLAKEISKLTGIKLLDPQMFNFANQQGSNNFRESARGKRMFVIGSVCRSLCEDSTQMKEYYSGDDNYKRLRNIIQTISIGWGRYIIVVTPYLDFAKQDRQTGRQPLPFPEFAKDMESYRKVEGLITMFPHCEQTKNAFRDISVDYIPIQPYAYRIIKLIQQKYKLPEDRLRIGAFDSGSVKRLDSLSERTGIDLFINYKRKLTPQNIDSIATVGNAFGFAVISIDDFIHSGGTLETGTNVSEGATKRFAFVGHIDSVIKTIKDKQTGKSIEQVHADDLILDRLPLEKFIFSDSTPLAIELRKKAVQKGKQDKIMILKASEILAHDIMRCVLEIPATELIKWP